MRGRLATLATSSLRASAAGSADEFGLLCLQALKGKAAADQVAADIVYRA